MRNPVSQTRFHSVYPRTKAKIKRTCDTLGIVDEGRKRVLWIVAGILAARKLAQIERPCPAMECCISDAISMAEKIMQRIDAKWPTETHARS